MDDKTRRAPEEIRRPRRRRRKKKPNPIPLILTILVTAFALWKLTGELADKIQSRQYHESLSEQAIQEQTQPTDPAVPDNSPPEPIEFAPIQVDFSELWRTSPDVSAWLYCPGTSINYPVVQTDNNQYYMHRLPNGEESAGGSLFVDCTNAWDFSDANSVIYGHDMKDGTMFGYLHNFDSQSYYENHPVFYLLTPGRNYRMDIICTAVVPSDSWIYAMQMEEAQLQSWLNKVEDASLIDPISPVNRDAGQYLTLSTCSYEYEDARFVVIGSLKKIY